jgi:hypothetical protein
VEYYAGAMALGMQRSKLTFVLCEMFTEIIARFIIQFYGIIHNICIYFLCLNPIIEFKYIYICIHMHVRDIVGSPCDGNGKQLS